MDPIEVRLSKTLVYKALDRYYTVTVQRHGDGRLLIEKCRNSNAIFKVMFKSDIDLVHFRTMLGKFVGDVLLVYSFGEDVIADWSNRHEIKTLIAETKNTVERGAA